MAFFFSSRRRHTRFDCDWSSDVCSSDLGLVGHFYAASGASGRTGVLMLGGSGGGYPDEAAARDLARAGYPVFALAYFRDYGGDPAELEQRHLRNEIGRASCREGG